MDGKSDQSGRSQSANGKTISKKRAKRLTLRRERKEDRRKRRHGG